MATFIYSLALLIPSIALLHGDTNAAEFPSSRIDNLEYQLELGRHEKFLATRSMTAEMPTPFTTDGCSGGLSVGWEYLAKKVPDFEQRHGAVPPWEECCIAHDMTYHLGGPPTANASASFNARKAADLELQRCVKATGKNRLSELSRQYSMSAWEVEQLYTVIAALMYRAVRLGGMPCTGMPWRWGFGWPECK